MSHELHLDHELYYKNYPGRVQEGLSKLLCEHRYPLGVSDFLKRLEEVKTSPQVLEKWNNLCPTLGDAIICLPTYPFGSIRIIRGNQKIWNYLAKSTLRDGVVELKERTYEALGGHLIPGVIMRTIKERKPEHFEEEIFSYLGVEDHAKERSFCFPKARPYPYLTLLALSHGGKRVGCSKLDELGCVVGVTEKYPDWVSIWLDSM